MSDLALRDDGRRLELRVLAGRHRGARADLPGDGSPVPVSRDAGGLIVLADLPAEPALLTLSPGGEAWTWEDPEGRATLGLGEALDLGGLVLQACDATAPWTPLAALTAQGRVQRRPASAAARDPAKDPMDAPAQAVPGEVDTAPPPTAANARAPGAATRPQARRRRLTAPLLLVGALLGFGLGAFGWVVAQGHASAPGRAAAATPRGLAASAPLPGASTAGASGAAPAAATPASGPPTPATVAAAQAAISRLELAHLVDAYVNPAGRLELRGVLESDEQIESLVREVRKVATRLSLRVATQQEFAADINGIRNELPKGITVNAEPLGVVVLRGTVRNQEALTALATQVNTLAPLTTRVDTSQLRVESEAVARAALARPAPPPPPPAPVRLPETSVVMGGADPFLILKDGRRLFPGSMVGTLRLVAIGDEFIEYQGADGQVLRAPR